MKYGIWNVAGYDPGKMEALRQAGYSPLTAAVLCCRGYDTMEAAKDFLCVHTPLFDPFQMRDMDRAVCRLREALEQGEHIAVFGDYDVDGITATCLLTDFLQELGSLVTPYIPARLEEGYGLNESAIRTLHEAGVSLIVSVDCGITACREAALCRSLGIDLIITDHHECKSELPDAVAIIDPHRPDSTYPHRDLAGVGVAFKLAAAICGDQKKVLQTYSDLLCLGTVADVMPLHGENRAMVASGLCKLTESPRVGIAALLAECGCATDAITASQISYTIAPRINAAGRMGEIHLAIRLLLTQDYKEAKSLASQLDKLNRQRQLVESEIYRDAVSRLEENDLPSAIVMTGETWHQGVVGIVASRLAEEFNRPAFLICMDNDHGKASSRSAGGFNLFEALERLSPLLENYGGHELAAGFTISREQIEPFKQEILCLTQSFLEAGGNLSELSVDCEIPPALLTISNIDALREMEPCGSGCAHPVFCMKDVLVESLHEISSGKHLRLRLQKNRISFGAIFFSVNRSKAAISSGDLVDVAFTPQVNEFRGARAVQLNLLDIRSADSIREWEAREFDLYRRYLDGESLTASDAEKLLPDRGEFVIVWRYLASHAADKTLEDTEGNLVRNISRYGSIPYRPSRTMICLDVFSELGLLELDRSPKTIRISLNDEGQKVDLSQSQIIISLQKQQAGEPVWTP